MRRESLKILTVILVVFLSLILFVACDKENDGGEILGNSSLKLEFYSDNILYNSQTITNIQDFKNPGSPSKEGYTFIGWKNESGETFDINNLTVEDKTLKLYAIFERVKFKVSFETNADDSIDPVEVFYGDKLKEISLEDKLGYEFYGWYVDKGYLTRYDFNSQVTNDFTLYGKWDEESYNINLVLGNGLDDQIISFKPGTNISLPLNILKEGYTFEGWFIDNTFVNEFTETIMPKEHIKLFAKWSQNDYKIDFDTNTCGELKPLIIGYGERISIPYNFEKDGYYLESLYLDKDFTKKFNYKTMVANDITLYAKFLPNEYVITLHNLGNITYIKYLYGEGIYLATPLMANKVFAGWYLNPEFTGEKIVEIPSTSKENIELYAKWLEGAKVISFESEAVFIPMIVEMPGMDITAPKVDREGYTLEGYYLDSSYETPYTFDVMPNEDLRLYVKWVINQYLITFDTSGFGLIKDKVVTYNDTLDLPEAMNRKGYDFVGWVVDCKDGELFTDAKMPARNLSLFAKWEPKECKIIFETNGGSLVDDLIGRFGEFIRKPLDPTRDGYVFSGWFEDVYFTIPYVFKDNNNFNHSAIKLYAKWVELVSISYMDGNNVLDMDYKTINTNYNLIEPTVLTNLYHPDYIFKGWYYDIGFTRPCDKVITLNELDNKVYGKWINRSFVPYFDMFTNTGNHRDDPIWITDREMFIAFLDYVSTNRIGVDERKYISLRYTNEYDSMVLQNELRLCTSQITGVAYNFNCSAGANRLAIIYVEPSIDVGTKTPNPIKKEKLYNGLIPEVKHPRTPDFDDFAYNTYEDGISVTDSNQLFYILQYGYKPLVVKGSPAADMLNKAKTVLREIIDDGMSDLEKMYAIYCWCQQNIYYDYEAINIANNTDSVQNERYALHNEAWHLEGVFNSGLAVCDGIAKAVVVLARIEGITCIRVVSKNHAWNKVYIDGDGNGKKEWYGFDATWAYSDTGQGQSILLDHFLFSDRVKTDYRNQTAINFLDIGANTEINPYTIDIYRRNGFTHDGILQRDTDVLDIIYFAHEQINENGLNAFTLNVSVISKIDLDELSSLIEQAEQISNGYSKKDIDILCSIFVEQNKYKYEGYVVVILVEEKITA